MAALAAIALATSAGAQERGEALANQICAACHGDNGRSQMPGTPSLAGQPAEFTIMQLILFREGLRSTPPMPDIVRGMPDADIEALAAYYTALPPGPPEDRAPRNAELAARGEALAAGMHCGSCHRPDHSGQAQIPRLAGQREEYLVHALTQYRDDQRVGSDTQMNGLMRGVSDADIAALAHYMAQRD
jgi:cytochrome c553